MLKEPSLVDEINALKSKIHAQATSLTTQATIIFDMGLQLEEAVTNGNELYDYNCSSYITINGDYLIQRVNFKALALLKTDKSRLINVLFTSLISLHSKVVFEAIMKTLKETKSNQICEMELLQKKGGKQQVLMECTYLKNDHIRLCLTDLTATRQLEVRVIELEKSRYRINNLFQHTSDAIAAFNSELQILIINHAFIALFSKIFAIKLQVGMNLGFVLSDFPDAKARILSACQAATLGEPASVLLEYDAYGCDDQYYCYEITIMTISNQYAQKNEFLFCITNLTDHKLQAKRVHKQQAYLALACRKSTVGEMASALAHEINQPLTAITAYSLSSTLILKNKLRNNALYLELLLPLEKIARQAEHAGKIVKNMSNFMHQGTFHFEETDINTLIKETLSILYYELIDFKLTITLHLMDTLPTILCNKIHVMEIILNLARNSIEALQSTQSLDPVLLIETCVFDSHVVVHVIDNGPGIPLEFQDLILNTYFTTKPTGTGLGLGVCRSLVEAHKGKLRHHKEKTNGAWFSFTLPIPNRHAKTQSAQEALHA